jgi:ribosomal protein S18 acetylase RimI-like enzyme
MSQDVFIRQASKKDLELITRFTIQLHHHESDNEITSHENFEVNLGKWLALEIENPNSLMLIADLKSSEASNQPIGFISATSVINDNGFLRDPIKGVIQLLWVDKKYRTRKIAYSLVKNIEACFSNLGIKYVECSYTHQNSLAENYWAKCGYKKTSITARKIFKSV